MRSGQRGKATSRKVEVSNVSTHGFWLLVLGREHFVPFSEFPWFQDAPVRSLFRVELPSAQHLYWPDLDIDLAVESIEHPELYPLVSQVRPNERLQRTSGKVRRAGKARQQAKARRTPTARSSS
jgi:hypothetical protein